MDFPTTINKHSMNGFTAGSNIWMGKVTPLSPNPLLTPVSLCHIKFLKPLNAHVNLTVLMLPEAGDLKRTILPGFSEHCLVNRIYMGLMAETSLV